MKWVNRLRRMFGLGPREQAVLHEQETAVSVAEELSDATRKASLVTRGELDEQLKQLDRIFRAERQMMRGDRKP